MKPVAPKPPISLDALPEGWLDMVREIIVRDGNAMRGSTTMLAVEIKSLRTNEWMPLCLPGGGVLFVSLEDRDAVVRKLEGRA